MILLTKDNSKSEFLAHEHLLEESFRNGSVSFYAPYKELTSKPEMHVAILTCIDCRIVTASFGMNHPGEAIIIRTAGALFTDDSLRNLLIAIYKLGVTLIAVIGHTDCGGALSKEHMDELLESIAQTQNLPVHEILKSTNKKSSSELFLGFKNVEDQIKQTVKLIVGNKLIPKRVDVQGYLYNTSNGSITRLTNN